MDEKVLTTDHLVKKYGRNYALNDVSIELEKGKMYGFIGENGAGKTTFIRLIAGLSFPTAGEITLFGSHGEKGLQLQRKRIGYLVEQPALFPYMSAEQNLIAEQMQRGVNDKNELKDILELINLSDTGRKKTRNFSMGMKQRLGIGLALIGNPELLILDEPINALDPSGINEIRDLLHRLNVERGITIFISSHILNELQNTVSDFIMLHKGSVIEQINEVQLKEKCGSYLMLQTDDNVKAMEIIKSELGFHNTELTSSNVIKINGYHGDLDGLSFALMNHKILIRQMNVVADTLEDYFLSKIGKGNNEKSN